MKSLDDTLIREQSEIFKKFLNRADPNKQADLQSDTLWLKLSNGMNMILNNFHNNANEFKDFYKNMAKNSGT